MRLDPERTFGIEIEFEAREGQGSISRFLSSIVDNLRAEGIDVQESGYTHRTTPFWKFVGDGSLLNGEELVSPILQGADGLREVEKVMNVLAADERIHVSVRCGFHVHHGARDFDGDAVIRLIGLYNTFIDVIDPLLAPSRRSDHSNGSRWARQDNRETIPSLKEPEDLKTRWIQGRGGNRYHAVNINPLLNRRNTIEFRQHQGTLNADKAIAWIVFTQGMMTLAKTVNRDFGKGRKVTTWNWMIEQFLRYFGAREYDGMDADVHKAVRYLANRYSRTIRREFPDKEPDRVLYETNREHRQAARRGSRNPVRVGEGADHRTA